MIWRSRWESHKTTGWVIESHVLKIRFPASCAIGVWVCSSSQRKFPRSMGSWTNSSCCESIREISRTSVTCRSKVFPLACARSTYWLCFLVRFDFLMRSSAPKIPVKGVRISCDMIAKNRDLALSAARAASRACCRSVSAALVVVMSRI